LGYTRIPVTLLGKFIGSFIAVLGIGLFALPAGIIASGFASELQKQKTESILCPHCGKEIKSTMSIKD
jgi:voltage-gated potassium channel